MNTSPLISVVIPAYNEEKYLPACLNAFKNQTFKDFELIVVDNNSTDKTAQIAKSFGARVVKEEKQGMTPARERGFKEAEAEIIARTDADTIVSPNWLEIIYKTFQENPTVVGITGTYISPSIKISNTPFHIWSMILVYFFGKFMTGHIYLIGPNTALKKSVYKRIKVRLDEKRITEDLDLSCHLAKVDKLKYVPELTVTFSLRRFRTLSGIYHYLINYPINYFKTLWRHHPYFRR